MTAVRNADSVRIALLSLLAFVLIGSYELIRSAADSIFIHTHGSESLPYAWLAVAATSLIVVAIYGRFATTVPLLRLLSIAAAVSVTLVVGLLLLRRAGVPGTAYPLYVFKDIYIVVLIEIFWSYANLVYERKTASKIYGLFCAMGSLGAAAGAASTTAIAQRWGSEAALWSLVPALVLVAVACGLVQSDRRAEPSAADKKSGDFQTVLRSKYLLTMLFLIGTIQIVITLVDYQFNAVAEQTFPDQDTLTATLGRVYLTISIAAITLQLLTGPILKWLGIAVTLIAIPCLLGSTLASYMVAPHFVLLAFAKVLSKSLDYSLFRAAKEILYIPLTYGEKTKGKAVVDILTYRVAKGVASLTVLALIAMSLVTAVGYGSLILIVVWIALTFSIGRQYKRRTEHQPQQQ